MSTLLKRLEFHRLKFRNPHLADAIIDAFMDFCELLSVNSLNIEKLNNLLRELEKCCYISIFKDAKPSNWVFQKNKVYAIDFDYVKKSFFLADLAQLLSYVSLKRKINMWEYVKYFLQRVLPSQKYDGFYNLFMLAVINSNIASSVHNSNLSKKTIAGFNNQNIKILKELRLIR